MQPAEIAKSYDSIAHQWLEPHLTTNGIRQHEQALRFRSKGGLALDVGCGCNGRFLQLLENHEYDVEGLDVSTQMIALAKTRNPNTTFYHADVCQWMPTKHYETHRSVHQFLGAGCIEAANLLWLGLAEGFGLAGLCVGGGDPEAALQLQAAHVGEIADPLIHGGINGLLALLFLLPWRQGCGGLGCCARFFWGG